MSCRQSEKYKTFSFPMEKIIRKVDKDDNEDITAISSRVNFIDSARLTLTSLWNLIDNLAEKIYKIKCNDCNWFLEYESVNDNLIKFKCYVVIKIIRNFSDLQYKLMKVLKQD